MEVKKSIIFLGFSDFPFGLAEAQKIILISKSLLLKGNRVTVIARNGNYAKDQYPELKPEGVYEDIAYQYVSGSCHRKDSFFQRRWLEVKGKINEFRLIKKMRKENQLDFAILSTNSFVLVVYYRLLASIIGFKVILNYVEFYTAIKKEKHQIGKRINGFLFDNYAPSFSHIVFPISEFLIQQCEKKFPGKPYLKISALTDFQRYQDIDSSYDGNYFLFCGYAGYKEIILFIIEAFHLLQNPDYFLYLVVNGSENDKQLIENYIQTKNKKNQIKTFSGLSQKVLFTYYKSAKALLIPLRPTCQDIARFPHKTGEYLASENPVISTNYGEMKKYFTDGEDMLLAKSYDTQLFAEKMRFVIDNPEESQKIGSAGMKMAAKLFDYRNKSEELNAFLNQHLNKHKRPFGFTVKKIKNDIKTSFTD